MTRPSLLSDEILRRLIGVGQVDIVVGVPTLNHAETIGATLEVIDRGLAQDFPRARTVVISADGGSSDGTRECVVDGSAAGGGLRTRHRICASYSGVPGRAGATRLIFTAADLLQAETVLVCDPDASSFVPEWIGALVRPVASQGFDLVGGTQRRHPLEGLLVTQLIRPLMRAAYGRDLEQPMLGAFACSRRFAAGCLANDAWERSPLREGIEVWLASTAVAGDHRVGQVPLGHFTPPRRQGPGLQQVFAPIVGALLATLDQHASLWTEVDPATRPPVVALGEGPPPPLEGPAPDVSGLRSTLAQDVSHLQPLLAQIVSAGTLASLTAIPDTGNGVDRYEDDAWVATVYDFAAAYHHGVFDRAHILQAMLPLYLGRVASFAAGHADAAPADTEQDLERLSQRFERQRPYLVERWRRTT